MSDDQSPEKDQSETAGSDSQQTWFSKTFAPLLPGNGMDLKSYYSCLAFVSLIVIATVVFLLSVTNFLKAPDTMKAPPKTLPPFVQEPPFNSPAP